jgi:DNA-binding CsgD family transcriptional regulator
VVNPGDEAVLWECALQLLRSRAASTEVVLSGGRSVQVRCEPVLDGGVVTAAVLRLQPMSSLAPIGATRHRNRTYGWESLTDTERSVADLVAQGLTNRQVAARMFLSPHTIDFHLRQIFRKLDIGSRVDLTRQVVERDSGEVPDARPVTI